VIRGTYFSELIESSVNLSEEYENYRMPRQLFTKGNKAASGRGPNKITKTVKETVLKVFNEIQSDPEIKLSAFAKKYPRDFYAIAAKLIPTEVTGMMEANIVWKEEKTYEAEQKADTGS